MEADTRIGIFIVEDDAALANEIMDFLGKWGYAAVLARRFDDIAAEFSEVSPQLVLLDINLPYYDGFYWCGKIRTVSQVPILFISSRSDDADKIMAVALGGDDYVEKPFRLELLKAKIEAIVRRAYQYQVRERRYLNSELYFEQSALFFGEQELDLTRNERKILEKLMEQRPQVVTREELMMELWSTDEFVSDGTLTTQISRLRNKLKAFCGEEVIQTRKGQGYFIA